MCIRDSRYPVTLYLVDNASPDGSGKKLEQAVADGLLAAGPGQQVVVHCRTENGGFGTGHNMIPVSYTHLDVYKRQQYAQRDG